jgi:iron complex transport system ATP-binding protein
MISVENITVSIGSKTLLNKVSVEFEPGKLNLIIGPNGAGKSTLIKVISKQLAPKTGTVRFGKSDLQSISHSDLSVIRAVLSQNIDLAFPLTVREVVMMGRYPHFTEKPGKKDEEAIQHAMKFFDVWEMADRNYLSLSGGEKQRVHFARVLAQIWFPVPGTYRYLILDEPLTFLDVYYQFQFMNKIKELLLEKDLVMVGVVHDLNLAARFADQIILLHQGEVVIAGKKEDVLTRENIKLVYQLEPMIYSQGDMMHLLF